MRSFSPEQVPVFSTLARQFAISDQWFCSAPTETFPNRMFVAAATSRGLLYDAPIFDPSFLPTLLTLPTVFNLLEQSGRSWKSYFHDTAFNWLLFKDGGFLSPYIDSYELHFQSDLDNGNLPDYAFIEPAYSLLPNDEHPPHDVTAGEALIANVYNSIRQSDYWENTLFVITYDEHGGCYDHVTPPLAPSPDGVASRPDPSHPGDPTFYFDRYGLRVPTLFISPYIEAGTVVRTNPDWDFPTDTLPDPLPFDHTTIIKTLTNLFDLRFSTPPYNNYLTDRDKAAPDLGDYLNLMDSPSNNPTPLEVPHVPLECYIEPEPLSDRQMKFMQLKKMARDAMQMQSARTGNV
jgi:phospholipase C